MRKLIGLVLLCIFVVSFAIGILSETAKADVCTAACINGQMRVCCFVRGQGYVCNNVGACRGDL